MRLQGKSALVTGASSGIGEAIARHFCGEGAAVVLADVDEEGGRGVEAAIRAAGGTAQFVRADVSDEAEVADLVARSAAAHGGLHVLVNNAGIVRFYAVETMALEDWNRVLAVNLTGPMLCTKHAIPHLRTAGGSVVNIASIHSTLTGPRMSAYAASKGGIVTMTRSMALELAPERIRVNAILPGYIQTPLFMSDAIRVTDGHPERFIAELGTKIPLGRLGTPHEVATLALYLASDEAGYVTGASFAIDAGVSVQL
jgi:NAD(P)-dependent dehydrogenase (short-subunit alcohol dehydrogenase family)